MDREMILSVDKQCDLTVFCTSDSIFSRTFCCPDDCRFAKFHHAQGGEPSISLRFPFGEGFYFFDTTHLPLESRLWGVGNPRDVPRNGRGMAAGLGTR